MTELLQAPLCRKHGTPKCWCECKLRGKLVGQWKCKQCQAEYKRNWAAKNASKAKASKERWARENPEKRKETADRYYRENKERIAAYHAQRYVENKEEILARSRAWKEANPEKCRAMSRKNHLLHKNRNRQKLNKWRASNPEKFRAQWMLRRARKTAAGPKYATASEIRERMQIGECVYCGTTSGLTVDHVVPLARGGLHIKSNLAPACRGCNCSKQDKPVESWYREQPFFAEQRWQRLLEIAELQPDVD